MTDKNNIKLKQKEIASAMEMMISGKKDEAEEKLKNLEKKYNKDIIIKQNLSVVLHQNGKSEKAILKLHECIKIDPKEFSNYHNIGLCYQKIGKMREAKSYYLKAVEVDKEKAHICLTLLGQIYFGEGNYVNSLKAYQQVIEINGKDAYSANLGKGLCLARLGYRNQAMECLEHVVSLRPEEVDTNEALGNLYIYVGLIKKGNEILRNITGELVFNTKDDKVTII